MGRKILSENGYYFMQNKVVPFEHFKLCTDRKAGFQINPKQIPEIIGYAENLLGKEYPVLKASEYMLFVDNGNRTVYQEKYYMRRDDILVLAVAEHVERKGRFTDQLLDLLWMILEETTWKIPAHNFKRRVPGDQRTVIGLPQVYTGEEYYIDLFAATTAATLAVVYYLCEDVFEAIDGVINKRLLYELDRRIIKPFLNPAAQRQIAHWSGIYGDKVNNWNPWILSNILTVCALTVKDYDIREQIVRSALPMLDNFTCFYHEDGGCEEGPSYWGAASAAYFDALQVLYDLTDGYINIFTDSLVRKMGEYMVKVVIHGDRVLNFGDSPAKVTANPVLLYDWGVLSESELMKSFGASRLDGKLPKVPDMLDEYHPYRTLRALMFEKLPACTFQAARKFWLDGLVIAGTRESPETDKGLYLAFKGGYNGNSHGHADVGSVIVFADGMPIFLDAGVGTYTRRTFSAERNTIWSMRADYHNVATINGVVQPRGVEIRSCDHVYDEDTGKLTMSLKQAYPEQAGIDTYTRSAVLLGSVVTVEDAISLKEPGDIMFSFICDSRPTGVTEQSFVLHGRTVTFDESLEYTCEALDKSWPETETLPTQWDVEVLYRITLKNKKPVKAYTYVLTVR